MGQKQGTHGNDFIEGSYNPQQNPILRLRKATTVDNSAISIKTSCLIRDFKSGKLTPDAQQAGIAKNATTNKPTTGTTLEERINNNQPQWNCSFVDKINKNFGGINGNCDHCVKIQTKQQRIMCNDRIVKSKNYRIKKSQHNR